MSAETWGVISLCGFALAGLLFIAAVILFIVLRIPSVIGDLSGRTVAREMARMREDNAARGERKYRTGRLNRERGPLTEKVPTGSTGKTVGKKNRGKSAEFVPRRGTDTIGTTILPPEETTAYLGTERLAEEALDTVLPEDAAERLRSEDGMEVLWDANATEVLRDADATEVLRDADATEVLRDTDATEVLRDTDATEVLQNADEAQRDEGTTVLSQNGMTDELAKKKAAVSFRKTRDVVVTHDKETERN